MSETVSILMTLVASLILIANGLVLLWLNSMRSDVRDLRLNYLGALEKVYDLREEVVKLKSEIIMLKDRLTNKP